MSAQYPKLILPRPHLSWSQLYCWTTNPNRYRKEYFEHAEKLDTPYLRFGGVFSKMVEDLCEIMKRIPDRHQAVQELKKDYPMDENMESVLMELPIEGISEYEIRCKINGLIPVLAYLDKYIEQENAIGEYKTGLQPWTLARVQKHDQLIFYAVALKWCGKPIPDYADLHWIETKETQEEQVDFWRNGAKIIKATGRIKSFHRVFDEREFSRMEELITRVAWEISDSYQDFLSEL